MNDESIAKYKWSIRIANDVKLISHSTKYQQLKKTLPTWHFNNMFPMFLY